MAIVVYTCDVCKRSIEIQRRVTGLENIQRCTITKGCRGKLYQTDVFDDYIRGSLPENVSGLSNWQQRHVLYNHQQAIEKQEWIITHNLGTYPVISAYIDRPIQDDPDNREELTPTDIIIDSPHQVTLRFDRPWSGIAQLTVRASDPTLTQPIIEKTETVVEPFQLTNNGELTIATRLDGEPTVIEVGVEFQTNLNSTPTAIYEADDQPSLNSPWSNFDRIVIKGKIYTVRSFNVHIPEMANSAINDGATFRFTDINGLPIDQINKDEVLILLASEPYTIYDKITDQYIDVTYVTEEQNPFAFYYDNAEFYSDKTVAQNVFPPVRSI